MAVSDDERTAAAEALRERTKRPLGKSMQLMFSETLGLYRECVGWERQTRQTETWASIVNRLADLIDRPKTRIDVNEHGRTCCASCGCDDWCLADGSRYCPNCGAEVVHDG